MSSSSLSAMTGMSQAIREQIQRHGRTLRDVPTDVLQDLTTITSAFLLDMKDELDRREARLSGAEARKHKDEG